MATAAYYRLETSNVKRSEGHSSVAAAAYITAEKLHDERTGKTYDFTNKQHVYDTEIFAPANAPAWVFERSRLWNSVEKAEDKSTRRQEARPARQLILSFPAVLTHEQKIQAARAFVQKECVAQGMIADVAYHDFEGDKAHNPHAHVLLTTRHLTPEGFAGKERAWNHKKQLEAWREKWAAHLNHHLETHGHAERVDHRSYEKQGIDRVPQQHEGRSATVIKEKVARGEHDRLPDVVTLNAKIAELNRLKEEIRREEEAIRDEEQRLLAKLTAEQDNRKPPVTLAQENARRVMDIQAPTTVDHQKVTEQVLKTVAQSQQPPSLVPNVTAKAEPTKQPSPQQQRSGRPPDDPSFRTYNAVKRQLEGMGGNGWFEIGIRYEPTKEGEKGYFSEHR
ncbi:MAG: MobA/MobL family protein, partial [Iphinoe sp. HA4291-MV1]|nr:MobA/MobL family protein [Iphinoe sp. HA4291-MV1]